MKASQNLINLSADGKKLLACLLNTDPNKRVSASEALRHQWFDDLNIEIKSRGKQYITPQLLDRLRNFKTESHLSKEVIRLLVMVYEDEPQVSHLKDAFFYLDILDNGVINREELLKLYSDLGQTPSEVEIDEIIGSLELRTAGVITYTEFVTATVDSSFYCSDKCLEEAFVRFDIDQDGSICEKDITDCFARFGVQITHDEVLKMIKEFDLNKNGKISKAEFFKIMKGNFDTPRSPSSNRAFN